MDHTTPPFTHADLSQWESVLRVDGDIGFPGYVGFPTEGWPYYAIGFIN